MYFSTSKKSMFNMLNEPYLKTNTKVSLEMIDYQTNDLIIPALERAYGELIYKLQNNVAPFELLSCFDKIDDIITNRFGIPVKHCLDYNNHVISILTVTPPGFSTLLNKNLKETYKDLLDNLGGKKEITPIDIMGHNEEIDLLNNVAISARELQKKLSQGIVIDRKNAKILNLPKDYRAHIFVNPDDILRFSFTPRELTAMVLHEMGHAFNEIEYCYTLVNNNVTLVDTFIDNMRNKNKSAKESLIIAYSSVSGNKDIVKLKNDNYLKVYLTILHDIIKTSKYRINNATKYQVERLSDTFAGRFGLHKELVSSLSKIDKQEYRVLRIIQTLIVLVWVFVSLLTVGLCGITGPFAIVFGSMIGVVIATQSILLYSLLFPDSDVLGTNIHGDNLSRYKAIRNDAIKQLRLTNLNKNETKAILANIETIDTLLEQTPKPSIGPIQHVINFLFYGRQKEMQKIDELLSSLAENDLHVSAAKLSTLS